MRQLIIHTEPMIVCRPVRPPAALTVPPPRRQAVSLSLEEPFVYRRATSLYSQEATVSRSRLGVIVLTLAAAATGPAAADAPCGLLPSDWCPAPPGDPCGAHADEASCRANARCAGLLYRGESLVACVPDGHGFWRNCPAVGCVSRADT